ncbi:MULTISPECIES: hypothetical protein [unclassified Microbacterium]|uniref:hypothetical protein n=1 Tax=unclassified Microbacterium TaxID=2609290 RepID=UPI00214B8DDC|nr:MULTISPECIES: hypothetical protein [unclassified Microbacterium]MCR2785438.1 hypothetical protein [Microbacterium sp. zg.B96]WIM14535.1 hypothetical protein QNO11_08070 [Microbacterium sp. zg-B96]
MALQIDIAANTRAAQAQVKDLSAAFDEVADSLDDLASDAARSGSKVEDAAEEMGDSFKDVAKDADAAADKMEDSFRDMVRDAKRAGDDVGDGLDQGFKKAGDGVQEFKSEANSTAREAAASFSGSAEDIGDAFQEVTANAFAGFGPAGAAAGLVAAAGIGVVTAELQKQQEEADKLKERLSSAYQEAAEEGRDYLSVSQLISEANDLMFNPERADEYKKVRAEAKLLAVDESTVIRANAGDLDAQKEVMGRINALQDDINEKGINGSGELRTQHELLKQSEERWQNITTATEEQSAKTKVAAQVTHDFLMDAVRDAGVFEEEVDAVGNKLLTLSDGTEVVISAETGEAHQRVDEFKGDLDGVAQKTTYAKVKVEVDDRAWKNWKPGDKIGNVRTAVGRGGSGGTTWD